jgi:hypothetical protein
MTIRHQELCRSFPASSSLRCDCFNEDSAGLRKFTIMEDQMPIVMSKAKKTTIGPELAPFTQGATRSLGSRIVELLL